MTSAIAREVAAEEQRRAARDRIIERAVRLGFVIDRDARFVVRRTEVYAFVASEIGEEPDRPALMAAVNDAVLRLGGRAVEVGNRRLYRGVRRAGQDEVEAARESVKVRAEATHRDRGKGGKGGNRLTEMSYEEQLAAEGMPAELPAIRGRAAEGVSADGASARSLIAAARMSEVEAALDRADFDRAVLRLTADGLSVRQAAQRLGVHRSRVERCLKRTRLASRDR